MPVMLGAFETSLRGGDSPHVDRRLLHRGCCGSLHGHGVKKERSSVDHPKAGRSCSHDGKLFSSTLLGDADNSSDESFSGSPMRTRAVGARSQSSDCATYGGLHGGDGGGSRRSSSAVVAERLYNSPTKATTAKLRAERAVSDGRAMGRIVIGNSGGKTGSVGSLSRKSRLPAHHYYHLDHDSGHFSSDTEGHASHPNNVRSSQRVGFLPDLPASEARKRSLITGTSDDELLSMEELRARQRRERRDYVMQQRNNSPRSISNPTVGPQQQQQQQHRRAVSPSPMPKKRSLYGDRGRRSSDELYSEESSTSPPATPTPRSASGAGYNKPWSFSATLPGRRAASSGGAKRANYAFGSSVQRFSSPRAQRRPLPTPPLNKSSSDGVQNGADDIAAAQGQVSPTTGHLLGRTTSDPRAAARITGGGSSNKKSKKDSVTKAWMQFKEDVESALRKKPNQQGFYKNLSDMMHTKMEMLSDEVGVGDARMLD